MRTDRRRVRAVVASALALVLLPVTAAAADPDPVGVGAASSPIDRADFDVTAWTDAAGATITGVTATLHDGGDTATVPSLTTTGNGHWSTASPLALTSDGGTVPHYGRWTIAVTATDSMGNTTTRDDAGTLDFRLQPWEIDGLFGAGSVNFTPAGITRTDRSVAVTGTVLAVAPGPWHQVPLANETVTVTSFESGGGAAALAPQSVQATTGTDGRFQSPVLQADAWTHVTARVDADDEQAHGTASGGGAPGLAQTAVAVTAHAGAARVLPGQRLTISGTVLQSPSKQPVSNTPVALQLNSAPGVQATVTTDATGHFSGSVVGVAGYYVTWSATVQDPFLSASPATGQVVVPSESSYSGAGITLHSDGSVTAKPTLTRTYQPTDAIYNPQTTYLQFSADGRTSWHNLAKAASTYGAVSLKGWATADVGWYRLYHPTTDELAATATTPVRLHRTDTRTYALAARPTAVRKGARITVSGTLEQYVHGWRPWSGQRVSLYFAKGTSHHFGLVLSGRSDAHGRVVLHGTATQTGNWTLHYFGDAAHFDSVEGSVHVTVR